MAVLWRKLKINFLLEMTQRIGQRDDWCGMHLMLTRMNY